MADEPKKETITPVRSALNPPKSAYVRTIQANYGETSPKRSEGGCMKDDQMVCERCGAEMYRMHAVWRCAGCGFKTDCCGW
jgi:ribosomal protein L37E